MVKRDYPPGIFGPRGRSRLSEYATQLREKQKAKRIYRLRERQFRRYFDQASRIKGVTGEVLIKLLEQRLDNVIFRLGFAKSRSQARQIVSHGHILVNGKVVNIPSFQVSVGDVIEVKKESKKKSYFKTLERSLESVETPSWLKLNKKALSGKVEALPSIKDIDQKIDTQLIVEFYSR